MDNLRAFGPVEVMSAEESPKFLADVGKLMASGMTKEEANERAFQLLYASVNSAMYSYNRRHGFIQSGDEDNRVRLTRDGENLRLIIYKGQENS